MLPPTIAQPNSPSLYSVTVPVKPFYTSIASFCDDWRKAAESQSCFSPRTEDGKKLIEGFNTLITEQFNSAGVQGHADKLVVLENMLKDVENIDIELSMFKGKLTSMINLEIQRYLFAQNVNNSNINFLSSMADPARDGWRLLMDGRFQDTKKGGIYFFDNEQGYMQGMLKGLNLMVSTLQEPLSATLYRELHDTAVDNVFSSTDDMGTMEKSSGNLLMKQGYRSTAIIFGLELGSNCTTEGLAEFKQSDRIKRDESDTNRWIEIFYDSVVKSSFPALENLTSEFSDMFTEAKQAAEDAQASGNPLDIEKADKLEEILCMKLCENKAAEIIATYHRELEVAKVSGNSKDVLMCIAKCCQDLDQFHLLPDGNIRAIILVMNKLLLQNNLSPVILDDPNVFDMHSLAQIVELMEAGQIKFCKLKH